MSPDETCAGFVEEFLLDFAASFSASTSSRASSAEGEDLAHTSIRFGIGRFNTDEEVDYVANRVIEVVRRLRDLSPLYEMAKEGIDLKSVHWAAE